jgi:hypothetical protein
MKTLGGKKKVEVEVLIVSLTSPIRMRNWREQNERVLKCFATTWVNHNAWPIKSSPFSLYWGLRTPLHML